jgi:hypothetical protein
VLADVVGTGGTTRVTGGQLQHVFGLLDTYAAFTTITSLPGPGAAATPVPAVHAGQGVAALVPLVRNLVAGTLPGLHGSVFPYHAGETVTVQELGLGGWRSVATAAVGSGGAYQLQLPAIGIYRVVYRGVDGPAVGVS